MKEYHITQEYDEDLYNEVIKLSIGGKVLFSVKAKEGNLLDSLKSKIHKEFLVYTGYLKTDFGVLKSNIGTSSSWDLEVDGKDVAKAEVKGIQYFNLKLSDGKQGFSGKTTDLSVIELKKDRDFGTCITLERKNKEKLDVLVKVDCKVNPEAILTFVIALDNKTMLEI